MTDEERDAKAKLTDLLYNKIDAGLYKKDAYEIVDAIEALVDARVKAALIKHHILVEAKD